MTVRELERKCAILAQTPQIRWFELRFKAFITMINNSEHKALNIDHIYPSAKLINFTGFCIKVENVYYFLFAYKHGVIYECFNVEALDLNSQYDNFILSHIILSSDDDPGRASFLRCLMSMTPMNKRELKSTLDNLFLTTRLDAIVL